MSDKDAENIKVTDRRHFSVTGDRLDIGEEEQSSSAVPIIGGKSATSNKTSRSTSNQSSVPVPGSSAAKPKESAFDPRASTGSSDPGATVSASRAGQGELNFRAFLNGLFIEAMLHLGIVRERDAAQTPPNLEAAQGTIEVIAMLQEKTKGNLTPEEQRFMDEILYESRMAFVAVTNKFATAPESKRPG